MPITTRRKRKTTPRKTSLKKIATLIIMRDSMTEFEIADAKRGFAKSGVNLIVIPYGSGSSTPRIEAQPF